MKPQPNQPQPNAILSRPVCRHIYDSGRRCRFFVLPDAKFCVRHIQSQLKANLHADLTLQFGPQPLNFKSASEINDFLCSVARLTIEDRISVRRASVLAYIASLELRTLPAIDHELGLSEEQDDFGRIVFDPPDPIESAPATALIIDETMATTAHRLVDGAGGIQ
jgi:hypothetical protein